MKYLFIIFLFVINTLQAAVIPYSNLITKKLSFPDPILTYRIKNRIAMGEMYLQAKRASGINSKTMEASFIIFLPPGSVVYGLQVKMAGKWIDGEILNRGDAAHTFNRIVRIQRRRFFPRDPGLLEYIGRNTYRLKLFPVYKAGTEAKILFLQPLTDEKSLSLPFCSFRQFSSFVKTIVLRIGSNFTVTKRSQAVFSLRKQAGLPYYYERRLKLNKSAKSQAVYFSIKDPNSYKIPDWQKKILHTAKKFRRSWNSFRNNQTMKWKTFLKTQKSTSFICPLNSAVAIEKGMRYRKRPSSNPRSGQYTLNNGGFAPDGYGGKTAVWENAGYRYVTNENNNRCFILKFYAILNKKNAAAIAKLLKPYDFFPGRYLQRMQDVSNINRFEWSNVYNGVMETAKMLKIMKKRNSYFLFRLHQLIEFSSRINFFRYGTTPLEIFLLMYGK